MAIVYNRERLDIPEYCPKKFTELIESCWQQKAQDRPTFTTILNILADIQANEPEPIIPDEKPSKKSK